MLKSALSLQTQRRSIHSSEKPACEPPELCSGEWRRSRTRRYTLQLIKQGRSELCRLRFMGYQWAIVRAAVWGQPNALLSVSDKGSTQNSISLTTNVLHPPCSHLPTARFLNVSLKPPSVPPSERRAFYLLQCE